MSERKKPPPLPGAKTSGPTPPPLPEVGAQIPTADSPPVPLSDEHLDANTTALGAQSEETQRENANIYASPDALEQLSSQHNSVEHGLSSGANEVKRTPGASKFLWLFVGLVGLSAVGGLGAYVFSKKDVGDLPQVANAPSSAAMPQVALPPLVGKALTEPSAAPQAATNSSANIDRVRELESQLAQVEAEKRRLEQASQQQSISTSSSPTGFGANNSAGVKPESRAKGEQCNTNSDCLGELRCEAGRCSPRPVSTAGGFKPESRRSGETCNSNSDCAGALKCDSGVCSANASKMQTANPSIPNSVAHLVGTYFVFKGSVKDAGNGYRTLYIVSNSDVPPGQPYAGQVKSQVGRYVMNCQSGQWGYDQIYFHAMPFGEGQRIATYEWQPNQVALNPIQGAQDYVRKTFEVACPK